MLNNCDNQGIYIPVQPCDECEELLDRISDLETEKQDTLIAGTGITINGNIISAETTDIDPITLTANGTYAAPEGSAYSPVTVSLPTGSATTPSTVITVTPSISVDANGLVTSNAAATQSITPSVSPGVVTTGTAGNVSVVGSNTRQLSTQGATTITPSTSSQTAVAAGKYTTGTVTVGPIPSEYIIPSGSTTITTNGTHNVAPYASAVVSVQAPSTELQTKSVTYTPTTSQQTDTVSPDAGYDGLLEVDVTVNAMPTGSRGTASVTKTKGSTSLTTSVSYPDFTPGYFSSWPSVTSQQVLENRTVTPSQSTQTVTPSGTSAYLDSVTVNPIPSEYIVPSGSTTLTTNGSHNVSQYETAIVSVAAPTPVLQNKNVTYTPTTSQQTATVTADAGYDGLGEVDVTVNAVPTGSLGTQSVLRSIQDDTLETEIRYPNLTPGYFSTVGPIVTSQTLQTITVSPTETTRTFMPTSTGHYLESVTVNAIPSGYVGSSVPRNDETDISVSGRNVTVPSGYYTNTQVVSVAAGSATTPATTITANPTISVSQTGLITATASASQNVTPTVNAGYVSSGTAGTVTVSGSNTSQLSTQGAQTLYPSSTDQTIASGKYLTGTQTFKAVTTTNLTAANIKKDVVVQVGDSADPDRVLSITGTYEGGGGSADVIPLSVTTNGTYNAPSGYAYDPVTVNVPNALTVIDTPDGNGGTIREIIGVDISNDTVTAGTMLSGTTAHDAGGDPVTGDIPTRTSSDVTVSGATVTTQAGYYASNVSKTVASGTAGTPTATKGSVSNHSVTVTPSVTNTTGYITGGTKTGTGVTVTASELTSGTYSITSNGTGYDVSNYKYVDVAVPSAATAWTVDDAPVEGFEDPTEGWFKFPSVISDLGAYIVYLTSTISNPTNGTIVGIVHDSAGTRVWAYNNGNALEDDTVSITATTTNNGYVVLLVNSSTYKFDTASGVVYNMSIVYGLTDPFVFATDTYAPGSGVYSAQFSTPENPPIYFCGLQTSVALASYHRVQTVVKFTNETFSGTNFYTSTLGYYDDFTEAYSNGTLTITSSGINDGGYFHNPGTYTLYYATQAMLDGSAPTQNKTVTPSQSTQTVTADTGYVLGAVTVNPIPSEYVIPTGNLAITQNGTGINVANYATVSVSVSGGGGANVDTKTATASNWQTSLSFTGLSGTPVAWFLKSSTSISSSGSTAYYYIDSMRYNGTNTQGRCFRIGSTRRVDNITSGYSYTYSNGTLTITSSASSRSASPGAFYNGTYELVYVY